MKIILILTWASWNPPRSSIGSGKMIVLFFSAEIECNVCKYLEGLSFFGTTSIIPVTHCTKTSIYLQHSKSPSSSSISPELECGWAAGHDLGRLHQRLRRLLLTLARDHLRDPWFSLPACHFDNWPCPIILV